MAQTINIQKTKPSSMVCVKCFMCDEPVELTENEKLCIDLGRDIQPKMCKKCKDAWMKFRDSQL